MEDRAAPSSSELRGGRALTTQAGSCTVNKLHVSLLQVGQAWGRGRLSGSGGSLLLPLVCSNPVWATRAKWLPREPFPFV